MKTEFLSWKQKTVLRESLIGATDPKQYTENVFDEIDRLENIIKSYELVFNQIQYQITSSINSKPKW